MAVAAPEPAIFSRSNSTIFIRSNAFLAAATTALPAIFGTSSSIVFRNTNAFF
ncbi:MAG: hypothetical protein ACK55Q_05510 [Dolichospermum sp.]